MHRAVAQMHLVERRLSLWLAVIMVNFFSAIYMRPAVNPTRFESNPRQDKIFLLFWARYGEVAFSNMIFTRLRFIFLSSFSKNNLLEKMIFLLIFIDFESSFIENNYITRKHLI